MSHRFTSWWRALSVVLLSLATLTWPSASWAVSTPRFDIVHQNALTTLSSVGTTTVTTTVAVTPGTGPVSASVAVFPALVTRSQLAPIVAGKGVTGHPLSATGTFDLGCVKHGVASFGVTLFTERLKVRPRSCDGISPRLHLTCSSLGCGGVYPLRYTLDVDGTKLTKWSLLAVRTGRVVHPLKVNFIATLTPRSLVSSSRTRATLSTLGHFASLPFTLSANYEALGDIDLSPHESLWAKSLDAVLASAKHRAVAAAPKDVDFAGLAANHFSTQVAQQFTLSTELLTAITGRYTDTPVLVSGSQSPSSLLALDRAGFNEVVLPEADLSVAPSSTLNWGAPFHVAGDASLSALSVDGPLSALVNDSSIEPGRRAALTLATLAFLHYEAPYAPVTRTVVIESPLDKLSKTFVDDLFGGLGHDAFSQLAPLASSFNPVLIGTNGAPATRLLATSSSQSTWSSRNVSTLVSLIGAVNSYAQGVRSGDIATVLHIAVAKSEFRGAPAARQDAIDAVNDTLNAQLAQFSIDQSPITLAGAGTAFPITVTSHLHYTVVGVVHLVTDQMTFPKGREIAVTMNSPTQSIRVPANPKGGSLTLQVFLTTPNGQVVLAHTAIQVHIASTSVVGYLLTFASLFVIGLWWWRTIRRRPKGRHAR
ncbi:MAG: hypothetical protein WCA31_05035 [Acidimicrobiales bacterium]